MNNLESQQIVNRFFEALGMLKEKRVIRGVGTFVRRYGINRRNFDTVAVQPERGMFQMAWLKYIVTDYGVNAKWLLTGLGSPFNRQGRPKKDGVANKEAGR